MGERRRKVIRIGYSATGMVSVIICVASLAVLFGAVAIAFDSYGHGDSTIAAMGFLAFFMDVLGAIVPIRDKKKRGKGVTMPILSIVGVALNCAAAAFIIAIYIAGLVI